MIDEQMIRIAPRATAFTVVCELCAEEDGADGWAGSTFAGRLDLDLDHGLFLCRRGHTVQVQRDRPIAESASTAAA